MVNDYLSVNFINFVGFYCSYKKIVVIFFTKQNKTEKKIFNLVKFKNSLKNVLKMFKYFIFKFLYKKIKNCYLYTI